MNSAFDAGQLAAAGGEHQSANPHPESSEPWDAWNAGHESYSDHDDDGEIQVERNISPQRPRFGGVI
jgi:hypothetical protein